MSIGVGAVRSLDISTSCMESWPCQHHAKVTLMDGRSLTGFDVQAIAVLVQSLDPQQIIYGSKGEKTAAWAHFGEYAKAAEPGELGFHNLVTIEEIFQRIQKHAK